MIASTQSVPGQPTSSPTHHGGVPSAAIFSWSVFSSSQFVGTV